MTIRVRLFLFIGLVSLVVLLFIHFETTVVPEWRIRVVDENRSPLAEVRVSQDWQDPYAESESHTDDRSSDSDGFVTFSQRSVRANLAMRLLHTVASVINPHERAGASSYLIVTSPGEGHADYLPGRPLPEILVVR